MSEQVKMTLEMLLGSLAGQSEVIRTAVQWITEEDLEGAASYFGTRCFAKGEILVRQGDPMDLLHFLVCGGVEAFQFYARSDDDPGHVEKLAEVSAPHVLGEISMALSCDATATLRARKAGVALTLSLPALYSVFVNYPVLAAILLRWCCESAVFKHQQTVPFFSSRDAPRPLAEEPPLEPPTLEELEDRRQALLSLEAFGFADGYMPDEVLECFSTVRIPARQAILQVDDPGDGLYLLYQGQARVDLRGRLATAWFSGEPNDPAQVVLGEMTFLLPTLRRTATVYAVTDCALLKLTPGNLLRALSLSPDFVARLHLGILKASSLRLAEATEARTLSAAQDQPAPVASEPVPVSQEAPEGHQAEG